MQIMMLSFFISVKFLEFAVVFFFTRLFRFISSFQSAISFAIGSLTSIGSINEKSVIGCSVFWGLINRLISELCQCVNTFRASGICLINSVNHFLSKISASICFLSLSAAANTAVFIKPLSTQVLATSVPSYGF